MEHLTSADTVQADPAPGDQIPNHTRLRRLTGWCGIGMMAAILVNGPLSVAVQRVPSYWDAGAGEKFSRLPPRQLQR